MGLDSVELVMSVEKEFGIEIPDRDAEQIQTVGGMHDYVFAKRCERDGLLMRHVFGVGTLKQTIAAGKRRLGVLISRVCRWLEWIFAVFATPGLGNPHHSPKTPLTLHNPRFGSFSTGC